MNFRANFMKLSSYLKLLHYNLKDRVMNLNISFKNKTKQQQQKRENIKVEFETLQHYSIISVPITRKNLTIKLLILYLFLLYITNKRKINLLQTLDLKTFNNILTPFSLKHENLKQQTLVENYILFMLYGRNRQFTT